MTEKRICETCAHLVWNGGGPYKGHPHCGHPIGPKTDKLVTTDETSCECHQTRLEKAASRIVHTSCDDAKRTIDGSPVEVLRLALQIETTEQNRVTLVKRISARLRKLEKTKA